MVGTRVRLRVAPGSARARVVGRYADGWKVQVTAPPEGGRANDAVVRLVAETVGRPRGDVAIVSGHSARDKTVSVKGIDADETERRLARACGDGKDDA